MSKRFLAAIGSVLVVLSAGLSFAQGQHKTDVSTKLPTNVKPM